MCVNSKSYFACRYTLLPLNLICKMTTSKNEKNMTSCQDLTPPQESMVCVMTAYLLSWCSVLNCLYFDMQHDYFQKKIWFDLLTPSPGSRCICGQNICYRVGASIISFNLISNKTIFWTSLILASAPPPKSTPGTQAFKLKSSLTCFISIAALPACKITAKNIDNCLRLGYCEILIFEL